jgi:hypothetical protein
MDTAPGKANDKVSETKRSGYLFHTAVALGVLAGIVLLTVIVNRLLPREYRECSLMPGFCSPQAKRSRGGDFEEIGKLRPGRTKFDLK